MTQDRTDATHGSRPRGSMSLYAGAFVAVLVAERSSRSPRAPVPARVRVLWASIGLSGLALVLAVLSLVLPRRR